MTAHNILKDSRFAGMEPFESKVWLSSPTMHGEEQYWVDDAVKKNWVSTVGANINEIEKQIAEYIGCGYAVALSVQVQRLFTSLQNWLERNSTARQSQMKVLYRGIGSFAPTVHLMQASIR